MKISKNIWYFQNLHIISWLLKDIFWSMKWVWLASFMVLPTSFLTIYILITDKENRNSNLILSSWVFMNVFWMLHELHSTPYWPVQVFMLSGILSIINLLKR